MRSAKHWGVKMHIHVPERNGCVARRLREFKYVTGSQRKRLRGSVRAAVAVNGESVRFCPFGHDFIVSRQRAGIPPPVGWVSLNSQQSRGSLKHVRRHHPSGCQRLTWLNSNSTLSHILPTKGSGRFASDTWTVRHASTLYKEEGA